jgi:hypothetical protein
MAIDAVLGLAFGGVGRFVNSRGENVRPPDFMPADVDAALAANAAHHAEFDIAPGIPVNVLSRDAHAQALRQAMQDVSAGRSVDVASIVSRRHSPAYRHGAALYRRHWMRCFLRQMRCNIQSY